ncbi:hypothetical protein [Clostridium saudiense]|uniref:hypothetical protein n=1 Tax=Clostridium saudiense TaxID=1414720 RepID=UPI0026736E4C|nr:hypothetical protein [Clostridium saudiense]
MKNNFLLWNVVEKKCRASINELENTLEQINQNDNLIVVKSLFVYAVSTFEIAITDILREFCKANPVKIPTKELKLTKEQILDKRESLIEVLLDIGINNLTYGSLEKYATAFSSILEISPFSHIDELIEIKETRNLMVHNNLIVNKLYLSKCKESCRRATESDINKSLAFDKSYAYKSINICINILKNDVVDKLKEKYESYTKIKAMKEIWEWLFNSPKLNFDEYWEYDNKGNLLYFKKDDINSMFRICYSTTEKILMALIMLHYWGSIREIDSINVDIFNLKAMYGERRSKYLYLQGVLDKYPELFTQDLF